MRFSSVLVRTSALIAAVHALPEPVITPAPHLPLAKRDPYDYDDFIGWLTTPGASTCKSFSPGNIYRRAKFL
jgi:hypothetical protein